MKTWVLGLLNLAFFSVTAAAFPHASLNQLVEQADPNCNQTPSNGLADLIHHIAADANPPLAKDRRGSGLAGASAAGMKVDEYKRAEETTGYVSCPGTKYGNGSKGSGALVGPGNQVLTSAHVFIDDNGIPREPLSECFFQNQANPSQRRYLNFTSKDLYKLFTSYPNGDEERDLALVRLVETDKPITRMKPFPVRTSRDPLPLESPLTMVSASHKDLENNPRFPPTVPIIQSCGYQDRSRTVKGGVRRTDGVHSDCVASRGSSGSIQMVRDGKGELEIAAITTHSKKTPQCAYNLATGCFTFATEITPSIAAEINEFQLANANTRSKNEGNRL